jgi:hypothetical protein
VEGNWKSRDEEGKLAPLSANADLRRSQMIPPLTPSPVPWSLSWREDGELAPQDRFDLLQTLVLNEVPDVQPTLIMAMERLSLTELTSLSTAEVTEWCA